MSVKYKVDVFDERSQSFILRNIDTEMRGLKVLLKALTPIDAANWDIFREALISAGHHKYVAHKSWSKHYTVSVRRNVSRKGQIK